MSVESGEAVAEREQRLCTSCGSADSHSKHIQIAFTKHPVTGEVLDVSLDKHIHCCAAEGCEICQTDLDHAKKNGVAVDQPSDELTNYMQTKTDDHHRELFERHGIESPNYQVPADEEGAE